MKLLTCAAARRRLTAFHDRELSAHEQLSVAAHLDGCPPCAAEAAALDQLGAALRRSRSDAPVGMAGLRADILSRLHAEQDSSLKARLGRLFEDMHLLWIGLAASTATLICSIIMFGALSFASPGRNDSLAAVINYLGAAPGSNQNPFRLDSGVSFPSVNVNKDGYMPTMDITEQEALLALSAIVTKEGRVGVYGVLSDEGDRREVRALLDAIARARFAPAEFGGAPVAVNMIWLVSHTTVRGKVSS
jgi:Putative zinc-finger